MTVVRRLAVLTAIASVAAAGAFLWIRGARPKTVRPENPLKQPVGQPYQVAENLFVIPDAGGNTAVFIAASGVVVVDPKYAEKGEAVLAAIRRLTDKPIRYVIDTHAHTDHFGGNVAMPPDAEVVLQEHTAARLVQLRESNDPRFLDGRKLQTFRDRVTLFDDADAVDLLYFGPAHTDGDTIVVFRAAGVMHAGDLFPDRTSPILNISTGGKPAGFAHTLEAAVAGISGVQRVITGHGPVLTWQDFVAYTEFNRRLLNHVKSEMAAGHTWLEARKSLVLPDGYHWERLDGTIQDLYKGLTPWWRFW